MSFGRFEPAPDPAEHPHVATCTWHDPESEWPGGQPVCSEDCAELARDERQPPRVRRAS